ncbi:MAG: ribonuclease III [Phycisphaerae bacterium]|nr:ribonuclease III [Phycisphaerae bacterium]
MKQEILTQCQEAIGYQFSDQELFAKALTHASVAMTRVESNERLEFLGDSVLGLSICTALYKQFENLLEGEMTKIKSTVVSRKTCAKVARSLGLHEFISFSGDIADSNRIPESVVAGMLESIIGAIYIDGGFAPADEFILRYLQPFIDEALANRHQQNFKSLLQQYAQRTAATTPEYIILDEQGPDHSKCFEVAVSINGEHYPSAWGRSKKESEQAAAYEALISLGVLNEDDEAPETGMLIDDE